MTVVIDVDLDENSVCGCFRALSLQVVPSLQRVEAVMENYYSLGLPSDSAGHQEALYSKALCRAFQSLGIGDDKKLRENLGEMKRYMGDVPSHRINVYSLMAEIEMRKGNLKKALLLLDSATLGLPELPDLWIKLQLAEGHNELYRRLGMWHEAYSCV